MKHVKLFEGFLNTQEEKIQETASWIADKWDEVIKTFDLDDQETDKVVKAFDKMDYDSKDSTEVRKAMSNALDAAGVTFNYDKLTGLIDSWGLDKMKNLHESFDQNKLDSFLSKFPDDTKYWSRATEEIADMYVWITAKYNDNKPSNEPPLEEVGRKNCKTPAEWNQKYKAAILNGISKLGQSQKDEFFKRFQHWLDGVYESAINEKLTEIWLSSPKSKSILGTSEYAIIDKEGRDVTVAYGWGASVNGKRWKTLKDAQSYLEFLQNLTPVERNGITPVPSEFRIAEMVISEIK